MQQWQEIAAQGYQAIFDTPDGEIIVQQVGPAAPYYQAMLPDGAVSDDLSGQQVAHILSEFGARSARPGADNE